MTLAEEIKEQFMQELKNHLESNPRDVKEVIAIALESMNKCEQSVIDDRNVKATSAMESVIIYFKNVKKMRSNGQGCPFLIDAAFYLLPKGKDSAVSGLLTDLYQEFYNVFHEYNKHETSVSDSIKSWLNNTSRSEYIQWLENYFMEKPK